MPEVGPFTTYPTGQSPAASCITRHAQHPDLEGPRSPQQPSDVYPERGLVCSPRLGLITIGDQLASEENAPLTLGALADGLFSGLRTGCGWPGSVHCQWQPARLLWPTYWMRLAWISPLSMAACSSASLVAARSAKKYGP